MKQPLVTVYIPTYNRLELLKRAVNSVLNQDYPNIELIIVDDQSTDGTLHYLNDLTKQHSNIIFLKNKTNSGACHSRNRAINIAQGEFITGLDDDDYFLPSRISLFINTWKNKNTNTVLLFTNRKVISKGKVSDIRSPDIVTQEMIFLRSHIGNQAFTTTRTARKVGGFDENLAAWQDFDYCLSLLKIGNAQRIKEASYIIDTSHESKRISNSQYTKIVKAFKHITNKHQLNSAQQRRLKLHLLNYQYSNKKALSLLTSYLIHGDIKATAAAIKKIVRLGIIKS